MKNNLVVITLLLFLLVNTMQNMFLVDKVDAVPLDTPISTWLWDTEQIVSNSETLFVFLVNKKVNRVYLQINQNIPAEHYKTFIQKATNYNIEIHALDGAPNWVAPKGMIHQAAFFNWVEQYQTNALDTEQFTGIHLDVEPYLYSGWESNYKKTVLSYQSLLTEANAMSKHLGLPLAVDIPFWFDEKHYKNSFGKGNLASWIIQNMDSITIMAYRDQAIGQNGIIELVKNEMNEANKFSKQISIAVETSPSSEANYVTFYEEGSEKMAEQLQVVRNNYVNYSSFGGFSIHSLTSWMNMQ